MCGPIAPNADHLRDDENRLCNARNRIRLYQISDKVARAALNKAVKSGARLSQFRTCNFGVFGAHGPFFGHSCGDWIPSQILQLR